MEQSETKNVLIKKLVSWALQTFNTSTFKSDIRMLDFWKLLVIYFLLIFLIISMFNNI